ncbi:MAG: hemerythrin domain-containing protein [FCB group bacterium]|nr:hemerythrin domain-containing protein [FCB group bacterium]
MSASVKNWKRTKSISEDSNTPIGSQFRETHDITNKFLTLLPAGHVLHILYQEHLLILGLLEDIDHTRKQISELDSPLDHPEIFMHLIQSVEKLVAMENHHIREEKTIFEELLKKGIHKNHHVLTSEHAFLADYKKNFLFFAGSMERMDFKSYKLQLNFQVNGIIGLLREHIFVENSDVFPQAYQLITSAKDWTRLKKISDKVGYTLYKP